MRLGTCRVEVFFIQRFRITDVWLVRHLQAVGHVAGETGIDDGGLDTSVLD